MKARGGSSSKQMAQAVMDIFFVWASGAARHRCWSVKVRVCHTAKAVTDLSTGTDPHRHTPGTHNHTQTPAEQGRRGQARQTHEVFRTRPTRRASKRARPTTNQSSSQPAPHRPRGPRAGRIPTPRVRSARPQGALNPGLPRDPARGGAHRGRERRPHTQHTHPHTLLHSLTPSRRDGRGRRALTAACCPPRTPRLLPGRPTLRRPPRRRAVPVSPPGASE